MCFLFVSLQHLFVQHRYLLPFCYLSGFAKLSLCRICISQKDLLTCICRSFCDLCDLFWICICICKCNAMYLQWYLYMSLSLYLYLHLHFYFWRSDLHLQILLCHLAPPASVDLLPCYHRSFFVTLPLCLPCLPACLACIFLYFHVFSCICLYLPVFACVCLYLFIFACICSRDLLSFNISLCK